MENLSNKIKTLRKEKRKTQQDIADLLKVRRSTYGEYERGKITPPMDKMKILANYFDVSIDYLMGNDEQPEEINIDVSDQLEIAIEKLKNKEKLYFNGKLLEKETREVLISTIENSLKMADIISKSQSE